jgi:hypothetical protein
MCLARRRCVHAARRGDRERRVWSARREEMERERVMARRTRRAARGRVRAQGVQVTAWRPWRRVEVVERRGSRYCGRGVEEKARV